MKHSVKPLASNLKMRNNTHFLSWTFPSKHYAFLSDMVIQMVNQSVEGNFTRDGSKLFYELAEFVKHHLTYKNHKDIIPAEM